MEIWAATVDGYGLLGVTFKALVLAQMNASLIRQDLELLHPANLLVMMDLLWLSTKLKRPLTMEVARMKSRKLWMKSKRMDPWRLDSQYTQTS